MLLLRPSLLLLHLSVGASVASPLLRGASRHGTEQPGAAAAKHGLLAEASFGWLNPMLHLGASRPLQLQDLPDLSDNLSTRLSADAFDAQWAALTAAPPSTTAPSQLTRFNISSVAVVLWRCNGGDFAWSGALKLSCDLCQIASPLLLKHLIGLLEQGSGLREGMRAVVLLLVLTVVQAFTLRHYFASVFRTGLALRAAVVGSTYRKLLRLSPAARLRASACEHM